MPQRFPAALEHAPEDSPAAKRQRAAPAGAPAPPAGPEPAASRVAGAPDPAASRIAGALRGLRIHDPGSVSGRGAPGAPALAPPGADDRGEPSLADPSALAPAAGPGAADGSFAEFVAGVEGPGDPPGENPGESPGESPGSPGEAEGPEAGASRAAREALGRLEAQRAHLERLPEQLSAQLERTAAGRAGGRGADEREREHAALAREALLGLFMSLVQPFAARPPAELAAHLAGGGPPPAPGPADRALIDEFEYGSPAEAFRGLARDGERLWRWLGWLADPASLPGADPAGLRRGHYHVPCGPNVQRVLAHLGRPQSVGFLERASPASLPLLELCVAAVRLQRAINARLGLPDEDVVAPGDDEEPGGGGAPGAAPGGEAPSAPPPRGGPPGEPSLGSPAESPPGASPSAGGVGGERGPAAGPSARSLAVGEAGSASARAGGPSRDGEWAFDGSGQGAPPPSRGAAGGRGDAAGGGGAHAGGAVIEALSGADSASTTPRGARGSPARPAAGSPATPGASHQDVELTGISEGSPAGSAVSPRPGPAPPAAPDLSPAAAAPEAGAAVRDLEPLLRRLVAGLLGALRGMQEDVTTQLLLAAEEHGVDALLGPPGGAGGGGAGLVGEACDGVAEAMGRRVAQALHKAASAAAEGMGERLRGRVPGGATPAGGARSLLPPDPAGLLSRLSRHVPALQGRAPGAESWAVLERGVRHLSRQSADQRRRLERLSEIMAGLATMQEAVEEASREADEARRREREAEAQLLEARREGREGLRQAQALRSRLAQAQAREQRLESALGEGTRKVRELFGRVDAAEGRAAAAQRDAAGALQQAAAAEEESRELRSKVRFLEMELEVLREGQARGGGAAPSGPSEPSEPSGPSGPSGPSDGAVPGAGQPRPGRAGSLRQVMADAIAGIGRSSSRSLLGGAGAGGVPQDDSLFHHPIYGGGSGRTTPRGPAGGGGSAGAAASAGSGGPGTAGRDAWSPGSAPGRPAAPPGRTYARDEAFLRVRGALDRGSGGLSSMDRRMRDALAPGGAERQRRAAEAEVDRAAAALAAAGVDLDVARLGPGRFRFNAKVGTLKPVGDRLLVMSTGGTVPLWDFLERLPRKGAR